jgi:Predicted membrane protein
MDKYLYWIWTLIVAIVVVILESWAVQTGNPYLAVITLLWAVGALYFLRTLVHEIIEDERDIRINERSAMRALEVFVIGVSSPVSSSTP